MLIVFHCRLNVADGIHDGGVISAVELRTDGLKGHLGDLPHDIDGNLACRGDLAGALAAADILRRNAVHIGNLCNDEISGLMQKVVDGFNFEVMEQAEKTLLGR